MIKQTVRSSAAAVLICATLLVGTGLAGPQARHPLEGTYEVFITRGDVGGGFRFVVSFTRQAGRWAGEVRNTPVPVTVNEITVTGETNLSATATANSQGENGTITLKADGSKITCNVTLSGGTETATITATKKGDQGKATLEGTYDARAELNDGTTLTLELIIRRMKPADK